MKGIAATLCAAGTAALIACDGGHAAAPSVSAPDLAASPAAKAYLDSAISIMQTNAYYRGRVDWTNVRNTAHQLIAGAVTPQDTYSAIRYALLALNDHHSSLVAPGSISSDVQVAVHLSDSLDAELVDARIAYLRVPQFTITLPAQTTKFADTLQALLKKVDSTAPCGWIVDLRHNLGGNMWPMLVGIGPLLGDGIHGYFVDADSRRTSWFYEGGSAVVIAPDGTRTIAAATSRAPYVLRSNPAVAVLTDASTASSGEAITVAFRGRAETRSFGAATFGVPTSNRGYPLSDGAVLLLTTAVDADRTGQTYADPIVPDEAVSQSGVPATDDATVKAASRWLQSRPSCK